jgi:hypothetical protein
MQVLAHFTKSDLKPAKFMSKIGKFAPSFAGGFVKDAAAARKARTHARKD